MGKNASFLIGTLRLSLYSPQSHSLKEKRRIVRSVTAHLRNKFNISISELGYLDKWQSVDLGMAVCGNDRQQLNRTLDTVLQQLRSFPEITVSHSEMEFF